MAQAHRIARPAADVPSAHVLVVEDDPTVAEVVTRYLERDGHRVDVLADGLQALAALAQSLPDLVVLDLMLPGLPGLELCRRVREHADVPIIILSARGEEDDRLLGLELGADDYLAKPFSPRELAARVRAVLRRAPPPVTAPLELGDFFLDPRTRQVTVRGLPVSLTAREFDLLAFLLRHPGEAFRREALLQQVWGYTFGDTSTVTVHVRRLREKIETDPSTPRHLETVWGVGYRFSA
jgi:DNA-binding response OmpR family regulator